MTAPVMAQVERPPRISPQDWERMPWAAKRKLAARSVRRPVEDPEHLTQERDEDADQLRRDAVAAYCRWRRGTGPELTDEQKAAYREYQRRAERRYRLSRQHEKSDRAAARLEHIRALAAAGWSLERVAVELNLKPESLKRLLNRHGVQGGNDALNRLRENRGL